MPQLSDQPPQNIQLELDALNLSRRFWIYENIDTNSSGTKDIVALRDLFFIGQRPGWQLAVSTLTYSKSLRIL